MVVIDSPAQSLSTINASTSKITNSLSPIRLRINSGSDLFITQDKNTECLKNWSFSALT